MADLRSTGMSFRTKRHARSPRVGIRCSAVRFPPRSALLPEITSVLAVTSRCRRKETMTSKNEKNSYRRVVTGHENGKSIIQSDERLEAYRFKAVPGFEHTLLWGNYGIPDLSREQKPGRYPQSLIPGPGGSTLHIVTYPPDGVLQDHTLDFAAAVKEYAERLPGLSASCEREDPGMHGTNTVDYAVVREGEIGLKRGGGLTTHLKRGD